MRAVVESATAATALHADAGPGLRYLEHEGSLSELIGTTNEHPIRLFDLDGLGVSFADLRRAVLPSFRHLPWDRYDVKREQVDFLRVHRPEHEQLLSEFLPRYFVDEWDLTRIGGVVDGLTIDERRAFEAIRPYRRRAVARFTVRKARRDPRWRIDRDADVAFSQKGDSAHDYRSLPRQFAPTPLPVTRAPSYLAVIDRLATMVDDLHDGSIRRLRIVCHQMGLIARPAAVVTNAPEGIHQDGSDYIVSALVIERDGVTGGESIVYGPDKRTEYLRHTLQAGQGIFQSDEGSPLWHWVTPVRPSDDANRRRHAVRHILGYDIQLG